MQAEGDSAAQGTLGRRQGTPGPDGDERRAAGAVHHHWGGGSDDTAAGNRPVVARFRMPTRRSWTSEPNCRTWAPRSRDMNLRAGLLPRCKSVKSAGPGTTTRSGPGSPRTQDSSADRRAARTSRTPRLARKQLQPSMHQLARNAMRLRPISAATLFSFSVATMSRHERLAPIVAWRLGDCAWSAAPVRGVSERGCCPI